MSCSIIMFKLSFLIVTVYVLIFINRLRCIFHRVVKCVIFILQYICMYFIIYYEEPLITRARCEILRFTLISGIMTKNLR